MAVLELLSTSINKVSKLINLLKIVKSLLKLLPPIDNSFNLSGLSWFKKLGLVNWLFWHLSSVKLGRLLTSNLTKSLLKHQSVVN